MGHMRDGDHELIRRLHDAIQRSASARLEKETIIERLLAENARLRCEAESLAKEIPRK
jgi:hypothetical protein